MEKKKLIDELAGRDIRRIGVLTGGGDCPGLNAVIRGVVKAALNDFRYEVVGIMDSFDGLIQPCCTKMLSESDVSGILHRGGTILGSTNRGNPFEHTVTENGKEVVKDISEIVIRRIRDLNIDALVVIGGDGTQKIALEFFKRGVPLVGVPKTIDNDLSCTDITFGFDTAVNTVTDAIDKLHTTAESHHRIMAIEVMGRDAGWIALYAGMAGGADVILIPEIPFKMDAICSKIRERAELGRKFSLVCVAEGAKADGEESTFHETVDGQKRLGGIGQKVADRISEMTGIESRVTVLGHVQRGGTPSPFDRVLATRFGYMAVKLISERKFGHMVGLRTPKIVSSPIADAVGTYKLVDLKSDVVETARGMGICLGDSYKIM